MPLPPSTRKRNRGPVTGDSYRAEGTLTYSTHRTDGTLCDRNPPGFHDNRVVHSQSVREGLWSGLECRGREELRRVRDTRDQDIHVFHRCTGGLRIAVEVGMPFWNLETLSDTFRPSLLPKRLESTTALRENYQLLV